MKYTIEFKRTVVQRYLKGTQGFRSVAKDMRLQAATVRRWVRLYKAHGDVGLESRQPVRYDASFKLSVLQFMWDNGFSANQASAHFNIRNTTLVSEWARRYQYDGADGLTRPAARRNPDRMTKTAPPPGQPDNRTREQLLEEIEDLKMEVVVLKKLRALVQAEKAAPKAPTRKKRK